MNLSGNHIRIVILLVFVTSIHCGRSQVSLNEFLPDNPAIEYMGRIDFSQPKSPRFWQPGVSISFRFAGSFCEVILEDEVLWGKSHNYYELIVDGKARRFQMKGLRDSIRIDSDSDAASHSVTICKNSEANIGYMGLAAIRAERLLPFYESDNSRPTRSIECIGNSITCGTGSDQSEIPCGKGLWQDQHNAYFSYGAVTARALNARYHLSAVSGIGLMHSCCNLDITMPDVIDKVSMRDNRIEWDFSKYQPDVLTISLGQNDGIQDSTQFCDAYLRFIQMMRMHYPNASIICLTSPMADAALSGFMRRMLGSIVSKANGNGDAKVYSYFFARRYNQGCDGHPSLEEHQLIAGELGKVISDIMKWDIQ